MKKGVSLLKTEKLEEEENEKGVIDAIFNMFLSICKHKFPQLSST